MPVHEGIEGPRGYAQWGEHGKKYYYQTERGKARALAMATRQGRAVEYSEHGVGDVPSPMTPLLCHDQNMGGASLWSHLKGAYHALKGNRDNLPPETRNNLSKYGDKKVVGVSVMRRPLGSVLQGLIKGTNATIGNDAERTKPVDKYFHTGLVLDLDDGSKVLAEKNSQIDFAPYKPTEVDELSPVEGPNRSLTPREMLNTTLATYGPKRVLDYNATSTNCQRFVMDNLTANSLPVSKDQEGWVLQSMQGLMPHWTSKLVYMMTSLASRLGMIKSGYGVGHPLHLEIILDKIGNLGRQGMGGSAIGGALTNDELKLVFGYSGN